MVTFKSVIRISYGWSQSYLLWRCRRAIWWCNKIYLKPAFKTVRIWLSESQWPHVDKHLWAQIAFFRPNQKFYITLLSFSSPAFWLTWPHALPWLKNVFEDIFTPKTFLKYTYVSDQRAYTNISLMDDLLRNIYSQCFWWARNVVMNENL